MAEKPPEEMLLQEGENRWGSYLLTVEYGGASEVTVRPWRSDDRLTLPESRGARSLKRLFAERGVQPPEREKIPVVCVDGKIAAVCAVGQDITLLEEKKATIHITKV